MPDEAVALDLYFPDTDNMSSDTIDDIKQIVSDTGFQTDPHDETIMAGTINFQPFENKQENRDLLDRSVEAIEMEFPNLDASYTIRKNRDRGTLPAKQCVIEVTNKD